MANEKENLPKPTIESDVEKTDDPHLGRQPQPAHGAPKESTDISHIDQQEGAMNHGETGGNFETEPKAAEK